MSRIGSCSASFVRQEMLCKKEEVIIISGDCPTSKPPWFAFCVGQAALMSIAFREGLKISPPALQELILSSNQDIRQVRSCFASWVINPWLQLKYHTQQLKQYHTHTVAQSHTHTHRGTVTHTHTHCGTVTHMHTHTVAQSRTHARARTHTHMLHVSMYTSCVV